MKIAHWSSFAPSRSGLYEAAKDLVLAERAAGIDALFMNMSIEDIEQHKAKCPGGRIDEANLNPSDWEAAKDAKIWVIHRGIPASMLEESKKHYLIMAIHGAPEHMMMHDIENSGNVQSFNSHINMVNNYDRSVALNEHDYRIWQMYAPPEKLVHIDDSIDVTRFSPDGYAWEFTGEPSILHADVSRNIKLPFTLFWAMGKIYESIPEARLQMYGLPFAEINTFRNMMVRAQNIHLLGTLESVQMITSDLRPMMRGSDIGVNPNLSGVRSRVTMEMMACGLPVVGAGEGYPIRRYRTYDTHGLAETILEAWEEIQKDPTAAREQARAYAVEHFDVKNAVETGWIPLYEEVG